MERTSKYPVAALAGILIERRNILLKITSSTTMQIGHVHTQRRSTTHLAAEGEYHPLRREAGMYHTLSKHKGSSLSHLDDQG